MHKMVLKRETQVITVKKFPKIQCCLRGYLCIPLISAIGKAPNKHDYTLGFQDDLGAVNFAFWSNWSLKSYLIERRKQARSLSMCLSIL